MRRSEYLGQIQVYSEYRNGYVIWKWNGRKYLPEFFTLSKDNIHNMIKTPFRVSYKDLQDLFPEE